MYTSNDRIDIMKKGDVLLAIKNAEECKKILSGEIESTAEQKDETLIYIIENYGAGIGHIKEACDIVKKDSELNKKITEEITKRYKEYLLSGKKTEINIAMVKYFIGEDIEAKLSAEIVAEANQQLLGNSYVNVTDQDNFKLPDMGDYYLSNIDNTLLTEIDKKYRNKKDAKLAINYAVKSPEQELGYIAGKDTFFLKAQTSFSESDILNGFFDCNTLTLAIEQLSAGSNTDALQDLRKILAETTENYYLISDTPAANMFELQLIGISAPTESRWCIESNVPLSQISYVTKNYNDIKDDPSYICTATEGDITFLRLGQTHHQMEYGVGNQGTNITFRWLLNRGTDDGKHTAAKKLLKMIQDAKGEIYIKFEACGLSNSSVCWPVAKPTAFNEPLVTIPLSNLAANASGNETLLTGYNRIHIQNYRRFLGEVYIKTSSDTGDLYINLAKFIANDDSDPIENVSWNTNYEGRNRAAFDVASYNINSKWYADAFFETMEEIDDRPKIQKTIHKHDWDHLKTWNVTIGDSTFFIPPVNIRLQAATTSERLSLLRSKGSAVKQDQHILRTLAMDIFFNEDRGINGFAYQTNLRDEEKTPITYAMNGLRALMAQFRFTPFLPITNDFINLCLGIDAVVVAGLQISQVPNYPKLIHATLTVQEFDWTVYMPDIIKMQDIEDTYTEQESTDNNQENANISEEEALKTIAISQYKNWFGLSINWEVFRYYYQRPIRRGDFLKTIGWDFNSDHFINATCGNLTSYMPMEFNDPNIYFYMANEDYLRQVRDARYEILNKQGEVSVSQLSLTARQKQVLDALDKMWQAFDTTRNSDKFKEALKDLNDYVFQNQGKITFSEGADSRGNAYGINSWANKGTITNGMGAPDEMIEKINTCISILNEGISDTQVADIFMTDHQFISNISKDKTTVNFGISIPFNQETISMLDMDNFKKIIAGAIGHDITEEQGNWYGPFDSLFGPDNNRFIIPLSIPIRKRIDESASIIPGYSDYVTQSTATFAIPENSLGVALLSHAANIGKTYKPGVSRDTVPDIEALMNLKYDKLVMEKAIVTGWSATMTNKVAQIRVLNSDGYAPQYLGGEDIDIRITIETTDPLTAATLVAIPKELTRLTRTYHHIMPCIPLRVDSEFTKFLGVHEVSCEDSFITTEKNYPGVYTIEMHLISVDRTVREKEAAIRKSINNAGYYRTDDTSWSGYALSNGIGAAAGAAIGGYYAVSAGAAALSAMGIGAFLAGVTVGATVFVAGAGLVYGGISLVRDYLSRNDTPNSFGSDIEQSIVYRHYFEMKKALAEVDLYPDLELPTLFEMRAVGYHFTKYAFQDGRVYVDPDFYFVYPVKLTSAVYRELAIRGMDCGIEETILKDSMGAEATIHGSKYTGFQVTDANDNFRKQQEIARDTREKVEQQKYKTINDSKQNLSRYEAVDRPLVSFLDQSMEKDAWKICKKIQAMFLEKKYLKEIQSYEARVKANSIGNNNSQTYTEGKYIYEKLENPKQAALDLYNYLSNNTIENMFGSSMGRSLESFYTTRLYVITSDQIFDKIDAATIAFLEVNEIKKFFERGLLVDINDEFKSQVCALVKAAACAATGRKEYDAKFFSDDWKPFGSYIGVKQGGAQNASQVSEVWWTDPVSPRESFNTIVKAGVSFGFFNIRLYTQEELQKIVYIDEEILSKPEEEKQEVGNINYYLYPLDPGYRKVNVDSLEAYKGKCICSVPYSTYAYLRLVMYWLIRLVVERALPTISLDIFRGFTKNELDVERTQNELLGSGQGETTITAADGTLKALRAYIDFYNKHTYIIDTGKMWAGIILASSGGDKAILNAINERSYETLNAVVETCSSPVTKFNAQQNTGALAIRKITLALVGLGIIDNMGSAGSSRVNPAVASKRNREQKMYIDAAMDPKKYIPHSFHDMIVYDARGRMLRAFPTFYMTFIDEGRNVGYWKMHDNFYNTSAILELEIVKSRKLPTDVCRLKISNFYNSYATELEDYIRTPMASFDDMWNSIFSPSEYFKSEEVKRSNKPQEIRLRLRQGARIHVRMGYGNSADMLPIVFNGTITELSSTGTVDIIAQGDGIELLNPIGIDKEAHNLDKMTDWFDSIDNGITPLEASRALFTTYSGIVAEFVRKHLPMNLCSRNAFGIVHFGDPDFKTFCSTGEPTQNLYETVSTPMYGGNTNMDNMWYATGTSDEEVKITFDMFQKTPWDILNICKSINPDARLAVMPWGFRSTCFMGMPHFYYCYDYTKDEEGVVKEKRKPFQQWHIYTADQDIIGNGIVATNRDMKNVAVGMYQVCEALNLRGQRTVGPLFADWDIWNECQKTMIVDTSLVGKGIPYIGVLTNMISTLRLGGNSDLDVDALFPESGIFHSHKKIAWKATASALRDSVQDMYAGDLVILGDPSIKPQDRMYIMDKYSMISGQALAKEVVHRMTVNEGFTTTISPDCIAAVHDNTELVKFQAMEQIGGLGAMNAGLTAELAAESHFPGSGIIRSGLTGAGLGALSYVFLSGGINRLRKDLANANSNTAKIVKAAQDTMSKAKNTGAAQNMLGKIKNIASKVPASISSKIGKITSIFGKIGLKMASWTVLGAAMLAGEFMMVFVNNMIEETLKNYKVIKIYPLKKFGYCWTAGFEGARGTVYGHPTWGDRGSLGDILDIIDDKVPLLGGAILWCLGDDVNAEIAKYKKDSGTINADGTAAAVETDYGKTLGHLAGDEYTYAANNYRSIELTPRSTQGKDIVHSFNRFKLLDINNYKSDPNFKQLRLISQDSRIVPYIDEQFFLVTHEDPGLSVSEHVIDEIVKVNGIEYRTKAIKCKDTAGNTVLDLPMLHPDALNVLYEVLRRAKNYMPSANATDKIESWDATKTDYIVLKGALRVGDRSSLSAAGFTFVLEGTSSNSQRALKGALESLDKEMTKGNFIYSQRTETGKAAEVILTISMPQVRNTDDEETPVLTEVDVNVNTDASEALRE